MSKLMLQVNEEVYAREERTEVGSLREAIADYIETAGIKNAKCMPVNAKNLTTVGKQILLVIKEVNPAKKPSNLKTSDTIHVGREISDMIREQELAFSALLDFPIVEHENDSNGAVYPLIVRPTATVESSEEALAGFTLTTETVVSRAYAPEVPSIDAILESMEV